MRVIQADMIYKRGRFYDDQATRSRDTNQWDGAIAIYQEAIARAPREDFYYLFLGRAYLERSTLTTDPAEQAALLSEAESRLLEAQAINPLNTDHTANLARLNTRWIGLGSDTAGREDRRQQAEAYYQDALALSPQNSIIRNEYARLAREAEQDCQQAIALYNESLAIDPFYTDTYFALAETYVACAAGQPESVQADYHEQAEATLTAGLAGDDNARAWLQAAQTYQQMEAYNEALAAYDEAQVLSQNNEIPDWNIDFLRASLYLDMGDQETARELAQQALALAPPEATTQIQALLSQLESSQVDTSTELAQIGGEGVTLVGERPLADLDPAARNNYYEAYPEMVIDSGKRYEAVIVTDKGEMRFHLFDDEAPMAVNNFVFLASQGFYDGTTFHRVLEEFMAQSGDPTGLGSGGPGYSFADETSNGFVFNRRGLLAMANAGPDTNGSQFFITLAPTPHLNGGHTIFGELIAGDDVLSQLTIRDPQAAPDFSGDIIERIDIVEIDE
jgi:cyclophilin family peptidyl-prolyl cis-trans isomerase